MKKVNPGFSSLTDEQRARAAKHSTAARSNTKNRLTAKQTPEFGVTRFANGSCLAQTITPSRGAKHTQGTDSAVRVIGIFDTLDAANQAYLNWREQ